MRFINYRKGRERRVAVLDGAESVDLIDALGGSRRVPAQDRAILGDTVSTIAAGRRGIRLVKRALSSGRGRLPAHKLKLLAPMLPTLILCSGANYWDHRDEVPKRDLKEPEFFLKAPQGVIGPNDNIELDRALTNKLDYETEFVIVIGKTGRRIAKSHALDHVFGYCVMNDLTLRDRQVTFKDDGSVSYDYGPGKNFETCAPLGPSIVTVDELPRPHALKLRTLVNGDIRQNNTTARMLWQVADLVKYFSKFLTLQPGMIISTGTPGGTAFGTDAELGGRQPERDDVVQPDGYLQPGDVLVSEIEGIGQLRNKVVLAKRT